MSIDNPRNKIFKLAKLIGDLEIKIFAKNPVLSNLKK